MKKIYALLAMTLLMTSCHQNPFLSEWDTPYGIPPYDKILEEDYIPAIQEGIEEQDMEIHRIVSNLQPTTFDNVIAALDRSGSTLNRVCGVLFNLSESDNTPSLQAIVEEATPMVSSHQDNIYLNSGLFGKVKYLYENKDKQNLTREQEMVLDKVYRNFVKNGIDLDVKGQARMREINTSLSSLELRFGNNLLAENNAFKIRFGVSISDYPSAMTVCEDRSRREEMFKAYSSRCNNDNEFDNKAVVLEILKLKIEKAKLLGYETPAEMILSDKMAGNPAAVDTFLTNIMTYAVKRANEEVKDMQAEMDKDIKAGLLEKGSKIEPWDWWYYADKVRKAKYDLDENEVMPYFKMENVREGVFSTASRLYGISLVKLDNVPLYNPEVEVFKVIDSDSSLVGIFMTDYFPRETKRGGAWMTNVRDQHVDAEGNDIRPIIVNVGNFNKPAEDKPSLLTLDNVETMFHEFGHALHGLLSKCTYAMVSGTSVARDFVELPSQINENWAFQKDVLSGYARHWETGEVIPDELLDKILAAGNFNQGFMTTELAAASILDMKWHELSSVDTIDIAKFEEKACKEMNLPEQIIPRYRTTYFNHIFNSGYSAGYYSYLWAEVLDKDAFDLFQQNDIFDGKTAMSFRRNILEAGGSDEPMTLYEQFRGAKPDPDALLRARGLK